MDLYAGFDLGGTRLKSGVIDAQGRVLEDETTDTPDSIQKLFFLLKTLWDRIGERHPSRIKAAGFGFPGIFHSRKKRIVRSPHCPQIDGYDLVSSLEKFIDVPFYLNNEANYAAYGEYKLGAGKGAKSLVMLTIGTGIGTGIILNGRLWTGACGFAGEIGHVTVNPDGERCRCGSWGCLETEVSSQKIVRRYKSLQGSDEELASEEIARLAADGDRAALLAYSQVGSHLGIGLSIIINLLNPEKIVLGGGVMESGEPLLSVAFEEARARSFAASYDCCRIERARLGNKAGFIGAALWARDHLKK